MAKIIIAGAAFVVLAILNFFLVVAALLGNSNAQSVVLISWAAMIGLAFILKRFWIVYAAQTLVTGLIVVRGIQSLQSGTLVASDNGVISVIAPVVIIGLGYLLAWPIARAVPSERKS